MPTLLYSPGVRVHISTDANGILDVSEDLVNGSVTLNENQPHTANFTLANPSKKYDQVFTPNDRITVQMKRTGAWLQIFSGYLDSVPFYTVYGASVKLRATCALKKIKYRLFDLGADATVKLMSDTTDINTNAADGGIGQKVIDLLSKIGDWDTDKIHIGQLPQKWFDSIKPLYMAIQQEIEVPQDLIGTVDANTAGASGANGSGGANTGQNPNNASPQAKAYASTFGGATHMPGLDVWTWMTCENSITSDGGSFHYNWLNVSNLSGGGGRFQAFQSPQEAANEAARWVNTMSNYSGIKAACAAGNPDAVAAAIIASKWDGPGPGDAGHYDNGRKFMPVYNQYKQMGVGKGSDAGASGTAAASTSAGGSLSNIGVGMIASALGTSVIGGGSSDGSGGLGSLANGLGAIGKSLGGTGNAQIADKIVAAAKTQLGVPYAWGGSTPGQGLDCSGLTQYAYKAGANIDIPRTSQDQYRATQNTRSVAVGGDVNAAGAGDLVFFGGDPPDHVALSLGGGQMIAESKPGTVCSIQPIYSSGYMGATRPSGSVGTGGGAGGAGGSGSGPAFAPYNWQQNPDPSSNQLYGFRVLMNDQPLLPTVADLVTASLRSFCTAPNGDFIAWFPDYFGQYDLGGTLQIEPIELLDFTIDWSDDRLLTHEFVIGDIGFGYGHPFTPTDTVSQELGTGGIVSIDFPPLISALWGIDASNWKWLDPAKMLERFGPRTNTDNVPYLRTREAQFWYALKRFMQNWAEQFSCNVPISFMPEAWPGMRIRVRDNKGSNVQFYCQQVTHSFNFSDGGGFTTTVALIAPSVVQAGGTSQFLGMLPPAGKGDKTDPAAAAQAVAASLKPGGSTATAPAPAPQATGANAFHIPGF